MHNQPVRYTRRDRSPAGSALAGVLVVMLAASVLVGTASMLAVGMGFFSSNASMSHGRSPGGAPTSQPAATTVIASLGSAAPTPVATASASVPGTIALDPSPGPGPFRIDLFRANAFVSELKPIHCVPAAMQTMLNIMGTGPTDRTRATQQSLYQLARSLSGPTLIGPGAEPEGWAAGLNRLGHGPYVVDVEPTRRAAVAKAAMALRMTGRPVGMLTWRGAHSWVMSGFTATADPAYTNDFAVTGLFVEDVWFPAISKIWGPSLPPDSLDPIEKLGIDYLPWRRPTHRYPDKDGRFVLVLPVLPVSG